MATTSFFYGGTTAPDQNTVDQLIDSLNEKLQEAEGTKDSAETAATSAATSAANAATSQSAAFTASQQAVTSATSATNAANSSSASATASLASSLAAATSEGNASISADNAASSESAALASETATATLYDQFDDRYLGSKATDPTVDNDGATLIDGALYFDTTLNVMKVYDLGTTTWVRTVPTAADQANINTVAGISGNVTTVATNNANVTTVASNIGNVNTVGGISANVTTVAGISSDVTTVAANITDVQNAEENADAAILAASQAATSASNASTSASEASGFAVQSSNSATTSVNSATAAAASATNATSSASSAASSASSATSSASSAASSASAAAASYDLFDDRYLGAKATAPSVDNDGQSLITGALYYNTTTGNMNVWSGSVWDATYLPADNYAPLADPAFTGSVTENGLGVVVQTDIGTAPNEIPLNQYLGNLAYQNAENIAGDVGVGGDLEVGGTINDSIKIDASGNVGIGTTSPVSALELYSDNPRITLSDLGTQAKITNLSGNLYYDTSSANRDHIFQGAGTEAARITGDGLVGIGTGIPAVPLHINGSNGELLRLSVTSDGGTQQTFGLGFATGNTNTHPAAFISAQEVDASDSRASLLFYTRDSNSDIAPTERLRITSSGSVGIGTSSPLGKLKVAVGDNAPAASGNMNTGVIYESGSGSRAINFGVNNTAGYSWINAAFSNNSGVADNLVLMTGATERLRIASAGDVNIGAAADAGNTLRYLDLYNTNTGASAGSIIRFITSNAAASGNTTVDMVKYKSGGFILNNNEPSSAAFTAFGIGGSERARITSTGNVGIGTSSPSTAFYVYRTDADAVGTFQGLQTESGGTGKSAIQIDVNGKGGFAIANDATSGTRALTISNNSGYGVSTVEAMRITSTGSVGIGTSSPTMKLDISGTSYGGVYIKSTSTNYSGLLLENTNSATKWQIGVEGGTYHTAGKLNIGIDAVGSAIIIDSSRNVGIGTSSPGAKLDVVGSSGIRVNEDGAGTKVITLRSDFAGLGPAINVTSNHPLLFQTNNTERARIDAAGELLVGTTSALGQITSTSTSAKFQYASHNTDTSGVSQISFRFMRNNADVGSITTTSTATAYNTSSDYRLKHDIAPMTGALAKVALLKPCTYKWNADDSSGEGFIAHELQAVVPDAVTGEKDAVDKDGKPIHQGVDTSFLVATLTAAIQELKAKVDTLQSRT
jgi:hypothetical protein